MDLAADGNLSIRYEKADAGALQQSTILRDVELPEVHFAHGDEARATFATYSWMVVLNQDCDLQFDRLARASEPLVEGKAPVRKHNMLRSIVLCPAFPEDHVSAGTYIPEAKKWGSDERKILVSNRDDRYHRLPPEEPFLSEGLILDFKLIVAALPDYLQEWMARNPTRVIAKLKPPFRDRLMQRFINYFGRIAEPDEL